MQAAPNTLLAAFHSLVYSQPHQPCLESGGGEATSVWSYAQAQKDVQRIAGRLTELLGAEASRCRIALISENSPTYILTLLAAWTLRAEPVLLPRSLAPEMLEAASRRAKVQFVLHSTALSSKAKGLAKALGVESHELVKAGDEADSGGNTPAANAPQPHSSSDDAAAILMTSSAVSAESIKLVRLTHANLCANAAAQLQHWGSLRPQRHLALMPIDHVLALSVDLCSLTLGTGGTYVVPQGEALADCMQGPQHLLHLLRLHRPTSITAAPFLLDAVAAAESPADLSLLRSLDMALVGGAPPSDRLLLWANHQRIHLFNGFGSTECSGAMLYSRSMARVHPTHDVAKLREFHLLACFDGQLKRVAGLQDEAGGGELVLTGSGITEGYLNDEAATAATFVPLADGTGRAFQTGSIFRRQVDDKGSSTWTGGERVEDLVLFRTGEKCQPGDVVRMLEASPSVHRAVVMGNRRGGEASDMLVAVIEVSPAHSQPEAIAAVQQVNSQLPPFARLSRQQLIFPDSPLPTTRKGSVSSKEVWRLFGEAIAQRCAEILNSSPETPSPMDSASSNGPPAAPLPDDVAAVRNAVRNALSLHPSDTLSDTDSLVSLGLTSARAARIASLLSSEGCKVTPAQVVAANNVQRLAVIATQEQQTPPPSPPLPAHSPPTVLHGLAFRLPGCGSSEAALWQAFVDGPSVKARPAPESRWLKTTSLPSVPGLWLSDDEDGLTSFDAAFFGISDAEARVLQPNARLALELSWHALEDAGIPPQSLRGSRTGIYVASSGDEGFRRQADHGGSHRYWGTAHSGAMLSGRLARFYDVHGPVVTLETACSGSLAALHQAATDLAEGRTDLAVVGAVTTHFEPEAFAFLHDAGMGSAAGRCAGFGEEADGYVPSEGAVFCVLGRHDDERRPSSVSPRHRAIIDGTVLQHDGRALGLTAPNAQSQARMLSELLSSCGLSADDIFAFEAHGTGTRLGDAMEVEALKSVFSASRTSPPLLVSSAKSTVGHLEEVAGLVGVLRAVLCLENGAIPPQHIRSISRDLTLGDSLRVPLLRATPLPSNAERIRICVSSLGFSGTIGALVVRGVGQSTVRKGRQDVAPPLTLSAKSEPSLRALARRYAQMMSGSPTSFQDLAIASNLSREHLLPLRWCASGPEELARGIDKPSVVDGRPHIVFVLGDQATPSGLVSAIRAYSRASATFRQAMQECLEAYGSAPLAALSPPATTLEVQRLAVALQLASLRMLKTWGLQANAVVGHSLGELGAAFAGGALSFEAVTALVNLRGQLMTSLPPGAMLSVGLSAEEAQERLRAFKHIAVAALNEQDRTTLSGPIEAIDRIEAVLKADGIPTRRLEARHAFHHPSVRPHVAGLAELPSSQGQLGEGPAWVSSYTAAPVNTAPAASFFVEQAVQPVRFREALCVAVGERTSGTLLIDLSHKAGMVRSISRNVAGDGVRVASLTTRDAEADPAALLRQAYLAGCDIDFGAVHADLGLELRPYDGALPSYPFDHRPHWATKQTTTTTTTMTTSRKTLSIQDTSAGSTASTPQSLVNEAPLLSLVQEMLGWHPPRPIPLSKSLTELGLDSLDLVRLHGKLRDQCGGGAIPPLRELFGTATLGNLQHRLAKRHADRMESTKAPRNDADLVMSLIAKYTDTSSWASQAPNDETAPPMGEILVTGAAGRVGAALTAGLIQDPACQKVHCVVRGGDLQRILEAMERLGHKGVVGAHKIVVHVAGSTPELSQVLTGLRSSVSQVVHLAWKLDFNASLGDYEECLEMTAKLAEFCFNRRRPIRMLFSSSVTAGGAWPGPLTPARLLSADGRHAAQQGYGLSKHCAEHILTTLASGTAHGSALCIVRIGQICGNAADGARGSWSSTEMFPRLLSTMLSFGGLVPSGLGNVDWIPLSRVVDALLDVVFSPASDTPNLVHLANPKSRRWEEVVAVVGASAGVEPRLVPLAKYVDVLRSLAAADVEVPSLALLPFFETLEKGTRDQGLAITHLDTSETLRARPQLLAQCEPLTDDSVLRGIAQTL